MKNTFIFIVFVIAILLVFFLISGKRSPQIPHDNLHANIVNATACLECHAIGKQSPLKPKHPPKEQCLICHKIKRAKK